MTEEESAKNKADMFAACSAGDFQTVMSMLQNGVSANVDNGLPVVLAAKGGWTDIVLILLNNIFSVANVHSGDESGDDVPLREFARRGNFSFCKRLIEFGADVHADNDYLLRKACEYGKTDMFKYLIAHGADVHVNKDECLAVAAENGLYDITRYLLDNGADATAGNGKALERAVKSNDPEILDLLISVAGVTPEDNQALEIAVQGNYLESVKKLLSYDASSGNDGYFYQMAPQKIAASVEMAPNEEIKREVIKAARVATCT